MACYFNRYCSVDPPCPVQLAPTSTTLPDHICQEMAWQTVDSFATGQPIPDLKEGFSYSVVYPLPIGSTAIAESRQRLQEEARTYQETYGVPLVTGRIPQVRLVELEEALLGLAILRPVCHDSKPVGHVWLLGIVEPATGEPDQPGAPGVLDFLGNQQGAWYRFIAPIIRPELMGSSWSQTDPILGEARRSAMALRQWYDKYILGVVVHSGSHKGGGTWEGKDHFRRVIGAAVYELRKKGKNPTGSAVRRHLHTKLGKVDKGQFTRWYQGLGWRTWQAFLDSLE